MFIISNNNSKEYVYFDTEDINSIYSQLNNGIDKTTQTTFEGFFGEDNSHNQSKKSKFNIIAKLFHHLNIGGSISKSNMHENKEINSIKYRNVVSATLHDNMLDNIIKRLLSNNEGPLCKNEGDVLKFQSDFDAYNVDSLKEIFNSDYFAKILKYNNKHRKTSLKNVSNANTNRKLLSYISSILEEIFKNSIIIKVKNAIIIGNNNNLRISKSQLQMLNWTGRKLTVFGRVEADISNNIININNINELLEEYQSKSDDIDILLNKTSSYISLMILTQLFKLHPNDKLIKPSALYFE